jgi:hypothetical protein
VTDHPWNHEIAAIRQRIAQLDAKLEELLAAGPIAPGIVEAAAELTHEAAQLEERLTAGRGDPASS